MSFLSRIRKSVVPTAKTKVSSSSSNRDGDAKRLLHRSYREKVDDDDQLHNYRKSTKSSIEKSLKPKNAYHSYGNFDEDENHWRSSKPNNKSNEMRRTATHTSARDKSTKSSFHTPTPTLSRSDTFTLDEENEVQNGTYSRYKTRDNIEYGGGDGSGGRNADNNCYYNNIDLKNDSSLTRNRGKKSPQEKWKNFAHFHFTLINCRFS